MQLASLSDLHIDHPGNRPVIDAMIERLRLTPPDVLILAGDLASDLTRVATTLAEMAPLARHVVYVPGNHDLWSPVANAEAAGHDTWRIYRDIFPKICHELGIHYLPSAPFVIDDVALVGTTGWYDFSLASRFARLWFTQEQLRSGRFGKFGWADMRRTCFHRDDGSRMPDDEVAQQMAADLRGQIEGLPAGISTVIGVTHVQPFKEVVVSRAFPAWDFFTAFMGTVLLGEAYQRDPRVKVAIYGHTHTPGDRKVGSIRAIGTPLGYPREWSGTPEELARSRMGWLSV